MLISLSNLSHTWFIDLDGTLLKHNGHLSGNDSLTEGAKKFIDDIPDTDMIIIVTSRTDEHRDFTIKSLKDFGIRYDKIIFGLPMGERIIINDIKPRGLKTARSLNVIRDKGLEEFSISIEGSL